LKVLQLTKKYYNFAVVHCIKYFHDIILLYPTNNKIHSSDKVQAKNLGISNLAALLKRCLINGQILSDVGAMIFLSFGGVAAPRWSQQLAVHRHCVFLR